MNPQSPVPPTPSEVAARPRINWFIFAAVLLSPIVASCLAGAFDSHNGEAAPCIAFFGGGIAGIAGGIMLGRRLGKTPGSRVALAIILTLVFSVACIGASCFGCLAGGYHINIR